MTPSKTTAMPSFVGTSFIALAGARLDRIVANPKSGNPTPARPRSAGGGRGGVEGGGGADQGPVAGGGVGLAPGDDGLDAALALGAELGLARRVDDLAAARGGDAVAHQIALGVVARHDVGRREALTIGRSTRKKPQEKECEGDARADAR